MTTTTPTPALTDLSETDILDMARAAHLSTSRISTIIEFARNVSRRAAQPVAPVQAPSELEKALRELMSIVRIHSDDIGENFAWAEMQYAKEVLATPSPQIAEVAELPPLPKVRQWGSFNADDMRTYARDAIAASRRAAGGEPVSAVLTDERITEICVEEQLKGMVGSGHRIARAIEREIAASTAPASAGQAAPALPAAHRATIEEAAQVLESAAAHNRGKGRTVFAHSQQDRADRLRLILAAQPAEGAGQAGQVAKLREIVERVRGGAKEWPGGWSGTESNCDAALRIIDNLAAPTERAAAPAELDLVACTHCGGGGFYVHKGDEVACRVCGGQGATQQPSAQVKP